MNLLHETLSKIPEDAEVAWVGSSDGEYAISWDAFVQIAKDIDYDDGYGSNEVPLDLVVVGVSDWWLERGEYDGSEWWELKSMPTTRDGKDFEVIVPDREWGLFPSSIGKVQKARA